MITALEIANYKTFGDNFRLDLGPFNVLVGPNACGKTNLVDALRFLQESVAEGLGIAAARRGGWSAIRCRRKRRKEVRFALEGTLAQEGEIQVRSGQGGKGVLQRFHAMRYVYRLRFQYAGKGYRVMLEEATLWGQGIAASAGDEILEQEQVLSHFRRTAEEVVLEEPVVEGSRTLPVPEENQAHLFVGSRFGSLASLVLGEEIARWRFYDPQPLAAQAPARPQEDALLSETGETLALVLQRLEKAPAEGDGLRERVVTLMQTLVPGFEGWRTELLPDGTVTFKVREKGLRGSLPAGLVSYGTLRLLILLIALLHEDERASEIIIEEPERGLHPAILEPLVALMRETGRRTPIIATTHSADFVRYCRPEEVWLMDKVDGLSRVVRASEIAQIETFLERFTLDELWLQGYLEHGTPV